MLRSLAVIFALATPAAAEEKVFDFKGIDSIDARNGVTVHVIPGDEVTVTATARSGDVEQLQIRKFGPWLALNRDTRWLIFPYGRQDDIVVTITLPALRNIKAFESAVATAEGFTGEALRAEAIQGGTVTVTDIDIAEVTLFATDGGRLKVSGTCDTTVAEATVAAAIAAGDLTCTNAAATTRVGGSVTAHATSQASVDDTAGGTITLTGTPVIVDYLPGMEPIAAEPDPEG